MGRITGITRAATSLLRTPKGKQVGGEVLGRVAQAADRATGRKYAARIDAARQAAQRGLERF